MNRVAEILEDIFFLSNTVCLSRLKYFIYSLSVKFICLAFIVYMFFIYKININGFMSVFFVVSIFFVVSLLLFADFNLTAKRLRDVGVPFSYWMSSIIFILLAAYLAGFDNQIIRWLVITVSMIPYVLPTGMIKRDNTDENC